MEHWETDEPSCDIGPMPWGDGIVDIGMIKKAGLGVAINASDKVNVHADIVTDDMGILLDYI